MLSNVLGFINGNIYVSFIPLRKASGIVVCAERILYVGEKEKAERLATMLNGSIIDLNGLTVMPGFIDSHMHVDDLAVSLHSINLRSVHSIKTLKQYLKNYYEKNKEVSWIVGRGWDQELFEEKRWPSRYDIDDVVPDKPVFLERICGHAAVVNTAALSSISVHRDLMKDPYFLKDQDGNLTGVVVEDAVKLFRENLQFEDSEMLRMIHDALLYSASLGVTTLGFMSCNLRSLKLLQILRHQNRLPVRLRVYMKKELLNNIIGLGIRRSFGDDFLKIMGIKIFADGSLGAHTAWLSEPYQDLPKSEGMPIIEKDELTKIVEEVHNADLQLAIHAIGDRAIDMVLEAYGRLKDLSPKNRHRIEHASIIRPDQIGKIAKLGVLVSIQPHFIISDWWVVKRVGERRAAWVYPFKSLIKNGVEIGLSSDSPVEPLNPWETVYAAISRGGENIELYKYTSNEALSVIEALHFYTSGSAYLLFEEDHLGTLEAGKYADFIIIDNDPLQASIEELKNIKNIMTITSGNIVYQDKKFSADIVSRHTA
ncbi:MAG: amidohydrolase [Aigarchaeota archaeon]|nr:amidohydrolase [Candidatus Geocrenenecus dongiae]